MAFKTTCHVDHFLMTVEIYRITVKLLVLATPRASGVNGESVMSALPATN